MVKIVSEDHYVNEGFSELRIESITEQIRQLAFSGYKNILEIGVGRGLLKHFLSFFDTLSITTIDLDERLSPDVVGSVLEMPFDDGQFEIVVCSQVLEHIPFDDVPKALSEIKRVCSYKAIISVPDLRKRMSLKVYLPKLHWIEGEFNYQFSKVPCSKLIEEHLWEIGCVDVSERKLIRSIKASGFNIEKHYRLEKNAWHHFFVLSVDK
jgi:ubiquinone/menaquinone biosynthesis C-methylase UbiE